MRRVCIGLVFTILCSLGLLAGLAPAADNHVTVKITGTKKNDTIRGTARGDILYGLDGNDTIYGKAGNDRITGGAGRDKVFCGAGVDRVQADKLDVIARDCEVITRLPLAVAPPKAAITIPTTTQTTITIPTTTTIATTTTRATTTTPTPVPPSAPIPFGQTHSWSAAVHYRVASAAQDLVTTSPCNSLFKNVPTYYAVYVTLSGSGQLYMSSGQTAPSISSSGATTQSAASAGGYCYGSKVAWPALSSVTIRLQPVGFPGPGVSFLLG